MKKCTNICAERKCPAKCCRYVAVPINGPTSKSNIDEMRWMLAHKNIRVYEDHDGDWFVEFLTPCKHLKMDFTCGIWQDRYQICRDHSTDDCEYVDDPYKTVFNEPEELEKWLDENGKKC